MVLGMLVVPVFMRLKKINRQKSAWLSLLFVLTLLALPATALSDSPEVAGRVIVTGPGVSAKSIQGNVRKLERRSVVYAGDTIETGDSIIQIRFADGSLTSLRPDTVFKIESFQWKGKEDGSEQGIFSLIRGGLSTISGLIGKSNKKKYAMQTPVATIGIRGTHYALHYCRGNCPKPEGMKAANNGLFGSVISGRISVRNQSGDMLFGPDSSFFVGAENLVPRRMQVPPSFLLKQIPKGRSVQQGGTGKGVTRPIVSNRWNSNSVRPIGEFKPNLNRVQENTFSVDRATITPSTTFQRNSGATNLRVQPINPLIAPTIIRK